MIFIVKVPGINGLGKTNGCEKAGNEILKALREIHSNESGKTIDFEKLDLEEIHLDNSNLELSNNLIYKNSFKSFEVKPRVIFLGGDHSISYSLTRGFFDYVQNSGSGKEPCLIIFDAHADCMPVPNHDGKKFPTHEEWLRALIEDGFPVENILLVGVRNIDPAERSFLKEKNIRQVSVNNIEEDLQNITETIMEFSSGKELYVSIDIDVVDPAFVPGTGYPESGGISARQFIYMIQRINKIKGLRGLDIVEINPDKDRDNMSVRFGAKILSELL